MVNPQSYISEGWASYWRCNVKETPGCKVGAYHYSWLGSSYKHRHFSHLLERSSGMPVSMCWRCWESNASTVWMFNLHRERQHVRTEPGSFMLSGDTYTSQLIQIATIIFLFFTNKSHTVCVCLNPCITARDTFMTERSYHPIHLLYCHCFPANNAWCVSQQPRAFLVAVHTTNEAHAESNTCGGKDRRLRYERSGEKRGLINTWALWVRQHNGLTAGHVC